MQSIAPSFCIPIHLHGSLQFFADVRRAHSNSESAMCVADQGASAGSPLPTTRGPAGVSFPVDPLCYLATPYSKYQGGLYAAFKDASKLAAQLLVAGIKVYSPIAHTHPLAIYGDLDPLDHTIWLPFDEAMMRAADVLIVAHMDGWQESKGIAHEIDFFERAHKPIFDLDPTSLTMSKRRGPLPEPVVTDDRSRSAHHRLDPKRAPA